MDAFRFPTWNKVITGEEIKEHMGDVDLRLFKKRNCLIEINCFELPAVNHAFILPESRMPYFSAFKSPPASSLSAPGVPGGKRSNFGKGC